jgi:hypothetical protein
MDPKKIFLNTLQWGFTLWLIGYVLGFVFFALIPPAMIGWFVMPIGVVITIWVLMKKIERESFGCYIGLGVIWTLLAIGLDYLFIVKLLKPADGYYKFDVYLYYFLTFTLPILFGWWKKR